MFYRTTENGVGWQYTSDPYTVIDWHCATLHGYFAHVERVSDKLAHSITDALETAEELGYFLYPAGSVKTIGAHTCAEALFLANSENEISKIMAAFRNVKPQDPAYKLGSTYYNSCKLANTVFQSVTGHDFPAWVNQ